MHLRTCGAGLALLLALPRLSCGQQAPPVLPDADALIKEGVALHDQGQFAEAAAKYRLVTPGDTAYAQAQGELALSLLGAEKYADAIAAAERARALDPFVPETYNTLASAHDALKQYEPAGRAYAQGLKLFPYNDNLWLNQGIAELNRHRTAEAQLSLQRALELNPLRGSAHRLLGVLAARQGQPSHALLSMLTFLAIEPEGPRSHDVLVTLERLAQGVAAVDAEDRSPAVAPNAAFEELDQLITSKVALNKAYVSKVKVEAGIVKQAQLLVEKFPLDADPSGDYWVRAYAPLVRVLRQDDNLTAFTYLILSSADDGRARAWVKAHKSQVEKMAGALALPLLALRERQPLPGAGADAPWASRVPAWFADGRLAELGVGTRDAKGEVIPSGGDYLLVAPNGNVAERGTFGPNGKKTGAWRVLRPDGSLDQEYTFDAATGEPQGPTRTFHPNGVLRSEAAYVRGKLEGPGKTFGLCGQLNEARTFRNNDFEGPLLGYWPDGQLRYRTAMRADQKDGPEEKFYPDGTPEFRYAYAAGKLHGPFEVFAADGRLEKKGAYEQDQLHGPYTEYHLNGQPSLSGTFARGKRTGTWRDFHPNGQLATEESYDEQGAVHGLTRDFDARGGHFADTYYEHGRPTRFVYFDAAGKTQADVPLKKNGRTRVRALNLQGRAISEGEYEGGRLVGEWKWFFPDGKTVREVRHYAAGQLTGVQEYYYATGQLRQRRHYGPDGQLDGYVEAYRPDGQLAQTGFYRRGETQGPWVDYYVNGRRSEEREYHRGEQNGPGRAYEPGGQLTAEVLNEYGQLKRMTTYDSTGKETSRTVFGPDTKQLVWPYPGTTAKTMFRSVMRCGDYYGPAAWLAPDGRTETNFNYLNGKRYGPYKSTHPNGQLQQEGAYRDGKRHGEWRTRYPDGTPSSQGRYRDDDRDGEWTEFFPNGQPERVSRYADGELDGPVRCYNPAGELLWTLRYERDYLVGVAGPGPAGAEAGPEQPVLDFGGELKTTFANGRPAAEGRYRGNAPDGPFKYYYASGQLFRQIGYQGGVLSGPCLSYWPNGKPMEEEHYLHGELEGRCRYYRPDGTLEREETYRAGEKRGPAVYYDAKGKKQRSGFYWSNSLYGG